MILKDYTENYYVLDFSDNGIKEEDIKENTYENYFYKVSNIHANFSIYNYDGLKYFNNFTFKYDDKYIITGGMYLFNTEDNIPSYGIGFTLFEPIR